MKLFATHKPRRFQHRFVYSRQRRMNFHREGKSRYNSHTGLLVVLLVLLLLLWFYI